MSFIYEISSQQPRQQLKKGEENLTTSYDAAQLVCLYVMNEERLIPRLKSIQHECSFKYVQIFLREILQQPITYNDIYVKLLLIQFFQND